MFGLTTLDERHKVLCKNTFDKINEPGNILHYLLPPSRRKHPESQIFKKNPTTLEQK